MSNYEDDTLVWFLSSTIHRFLNNNLFLRMESRKQRRTKMKSNFYHDKIEGPQMIRAIFIPEERDDISTTTPLDVIGEIFLYDGDLYTYTKDLEYKKLAVVA